MKRILLLYPLIFITFTSFANGKLDSLYQELEDTNDDSTSVSLLIEIAQSHSNFDSLLYYAHEGLGKCDSIQYADQYAQLLNTASGLLLNVPPKR